MKILRIVWLILLVSIAGLFCKCSSNTGNDLILNEGPIEQTLDSAIRNLTYDGLDSAVLNHFDFYPDILRNYSSIDLDDLEFIGDTTVPVPIRELSSRLSKKVMDSVDFKFKDNYKFGSNIIVEGGLNHALSIISKQGLRQKYFGSINLSDPIFSKDSTRSCYYFALNCITVREKGCTFSAAIFCRKERNRWVIEFLKTLRETEPIEGQRNS